MIRRSVVIGIIAALLLVPLPASLAQDGGSYLLARSRGPILWHIADEELRRRMENDLELLRLFNEAAAAKRKRKSLGMALFTPGAILVGVGFAAGVFRGTLGFYDQETGDYLMIGGFALGVALITPGVYFSAFKSGAEKRYEEYMQETYDVTPIMWFDPDSGSYTLGMRIRF